MAILKALPGAPEFKALPGSAKVNGKPVNGKPVKGKLIKIKKSVININKFLTRRNEQTKKQIEKNKKQNQNFKRRKNEEKLEEPKKEWKKLVPKKIPGLSFFDSIKKFVSGWILGFVAIKLIPLLPKLIPVVLQLGKIVNWFINIGGKFLNGFISFIDFGIKAQEATFGFLKTLGGEKFANVMANFAKGFGGAIDAMLLTGMFLISEAMTGDSGLGLITDWITQNLMKKLFGKTVATSATSALATTGGTTAATTTAAGTTAAGTTAGGTAGGGAASTAGGIGAGAAAGIVAGAGLLASGLGEGAFQMLREARKQEAKTYEFFKEKSWLNPMKYFWGAVHLAQKFGNFQMQILGTILDILGAPFRYIIELVRYPFLSEEGKKKQHENLAKFDARIRESFREIVNTLSLGMLAKEKGAFGSLFGKKGTDAMGYTKDGKTESQRAPGKKGMIVLATPHLEKTKDFLDGRPSGESVHTILKVTEGGGDASDLSKITDPSKTTDPSKVAAKPKGKAGAIVGGLLGAAVLGPVGAIAGAAIGNTIQKRGIKGAIGGAADFVTGGMFDFDKQNRKGAPKDYGIRRIAGGVADWATMGLTDFDKRGKGNLQFNPIGGGKDKAWGSRNEQAKRREKQSGFGLKRGIGGALDFATLGMFDFDKQNRKGAPKGFGIKRIAGGIADWATMGLTDFDQRGAGVMQFDPIGGKRNQRNLSRGGGSSEYYPIDQPRANNYAEMQEYYKNNPEVAKGGEWVSAGDQWVLLTPEQSKERKDKLVKAAEGGDKYAESLLNFDDPSWRENNVKGTPDLKLGKQPVKFDEELLGISASYEADGSQQEYTIYAPTTQINMLPGNDSGQVVTSGASSPSGDDPYEILEKGG